MNAREAVALTEIDDPLLACQQILDWVEQKAPLRRNVTGQDVGDSAAFLLSDLYSGMTGQIVHVDCGYSTVAMPSPNTTAVASCFHQSAVGLSRE